MLLKAAYTYNMITPRFSRSQFRHSFQLFVLSLQIQLYQLASADVSSLEGAKLIGLRLVGTVGTEWEVFSITDGKTLEATLDTDTT